MIIFKINITMKRGRKPALTKESAFVEMRLHVSLILMDSRAIDACGLALKWSISVYILSNTPKSKKPHLY